MKVLVKPGVLFTDPADPTRPLIAPAGYVILEALKSAANRLGTDLRITSGTDGAHSGPLDPHHTGEAYDVGSHEFSSALRPVVLRTIMDGLDPARFYGFLEFPDTIDEHFHIQRRKATTFTVLDLLAWEAA